MHVHLHELLAQRVGARDERCLRLGGGALGFLGGRGRGVRLQAHGHGGDELLDAVLAGDSAVAEVDVGGEHGVHLARARKQPRHLLGERVARRLVRPEELAERGHAEGHEPAAQRAHRLREVGRGLAEGGLRLHLQLQHGRLDERLEPLDRVPVALVVVQRRIAEEDGAVRVGEAAHEQLLELEPAAQQEAQVAGEGEVGGEAQQLRLVVAHQLVAVPVCRGGARGRREQRAGAAAEGEAEVGHGVLEAASGVLGEAAGRVLVRSLQRLDDVEHVRVATREALADDLEGSRHDVGPLDGDRHGHRHVRVAQEVGMAARDARPRQHVHAALEHAPAPLGARLLHNGGEHHRRLVVVDDGVGELGGGENDVRFASRLGHGLLDATELSDGHLELLAHARVRPHACTHGACRSHGAGGERDASPLGQTLDEHMPAVAAAALPPQDALHRNPHAVALDGAVHEGRVHRHVPRAHVQPLVPALEQRDSEALDALAAQ
mmetsp:Transcript_19550/g.39852  ORF Transcript_19550/g.39852 Transcript_19550/m.39852 type:complete len:492 (-) Transcript_19550:778-2253(-)